MKRDPNEDFDNKQYWLEVWKMIFVFLATLACLFFVGGIMAGYNMWQVSWLMIVSLVFVYVAERLKKKIKGNYDDAYIGKKIKK